jgi:hypothetical protein
MALSAPLATSASMSSNRSRRGCRDRSRSSERSVASVVNPRGTLDRAMPRRHRPCRSRRGRGSSPQRECARASAGRRREHPHTGSGARERRPAPSAWRMRRRADERVPVPAATSRGRTRRCRTPTPPRSRRTAVLRSHPPPARPTWHGQADAASNGHPSFGPQAVADGAVRHPGFVGTVAWLRAHPAEPRRRAASPCRAAPVARPVGARRRLDRSSQQHGGAGRSRFAPIHSAGSTPSGRRRIRGASPTPTLLPWFFHRRRETGSGPYGSRPFA